MTRDLHFPVERREDPLFRAKRRAVVKASLAKMAKILNTRLDVTEDEVIEAYTDATAFLAHRFIGAAAEHLLAHSEYFPKPAELRKAAVEFEQREYRAEQQARAAQRENPDPNVCPQCLGEYTWCVPADSITRQPRMLCPCQIRKAEETASHFAASIQAKRDAYDLEQAERAARRQRYAAPLPEDEAEAVGHA